MAMKSVKKILWISLSAAVLFILFLLWYKNEYSMDKAEAFEVNSEIVTSKLLIATQGSDFKNTVTTGVVEYYKSDAAFIKVIDVSSLPEVDPEDYDAILLIHTWENWKPPEAVKSFMERTLSYRDKMVVLTTSGEGSYKMEGVDAITGESKLTETPLYTEKIILKLNTIL